MIDPAAIAAAAQRIAPHVNRTPLFRSAPLSERHGADISIKAEHLQRTGSFKVRGSANVIHSLDESLAADGVITASSGNHGIGVATAAASRRFACTIYLPSGAAAAKVDQIRRLGAHVEFVDDTDSSVAETTARRAAAATGRTYVSPYNDPAIVAGQGTIGLEILDDAPAPDAVVVAVGGGGLIGGIATWIKAHSPTTRVIGASALNDRAMAASVAAGRIVTPTFEPTFSDGTAGGIEDDSITFALCQQLVDEWIDVAEVDIARGVADMIDDHHQLVEGSAGLAIAAATHYAAAHPASRIVVVSCGANVGRATLAAMLTMAG